MVQLIKDESGCNNSSEREKKEGRDVRRNAIEAGYSYKLSKTYQGLCSFVCVCYLQYNHAINVPYKKGFVFPSL